MAKKGKVQAEAAAPDVLPAGDAELSKKIQSLKSDGTMSFAKKEYPKALELYEQAIQLLPSDSSERADLHTNKGACYICLKQWKDAVKECSSALEIQPSSAKALKNRAKAFQEQGQLKSALADIQAINKTSAATEESKGFEKRLKEDLTTSKKPSSSNGSAALPPSRATPKQQIQSFVTKCTYGNETRLLHILPSTTYAEYLELVQAKFPSAGQFLIQYISQDGSPVVIRSKADLQTGLAGVLAAYQKQSGNQRTNLLAQASVPPLRIQLVPVTDPAEIPTVPMDEQYVALQNKVQAARQQQELAQQRQLLQQQQRRELDPPPPPVLTQTPNGEVVEAWLVDFVHVFQEITSIEPDKHVEAYHAGYEACARGGEATMPSSEALPALALAESKFVDVVCAGLIGWGYVHIALGRRLVEQLSREGAVAADVTAKMAVEFNIAQEKLEKALTYKPTCHEALVALAQLQLDRAMITAGYPKHKEQPESLEPAVRRAELTAALAGLKAADVRAACADVTLMHQYMERATAITDEAAAGNPLEGDSKTADLRSHLLVLHGNLGYEWSQVLAAVKEPGWRAELDAAVARFRSAGCAVADLKNAMKTHVAADELEGVLEKLEEAAAAPAAGAEAEAKGPEAKGLPSLEVKGKGKKKK